MSTLFLLFTYYYVCGGKATRIMSWGGRFTVARITGSINLGQEEGDLPLVKRPETLNNVEFPAFAFSNRNNNPGLGPAFARRKKPLLAEKQARNSLQTLTMSSL